METIVAARNSMNGCCMSSYFAILRENCLNIPLSPSNFFFCASCKLNTLTSCTASRFSPNSCAISLRPICALPANRFMFLRIIWTGRMQKGTAAKNMKSITTCPFVKQR